MSRLASISGAGVAVLAAVVLAACSASSHGAGPLGNGGDPGGDCSPAAWGHPVTMAVVVLDNKGRNTVTIASVSLAHPHELRILVPFLLPRLAGLSIGAGRPYPPAVPQWALRKPAVGYRIPAGGSRVLAFGLLPATRGGGHSGGATVDYTAGGNDYTYQSNYAFKVVVRPAHC